LGYRVRARIWKTWCSLGRHGGGSTVHSYCVRRRELIERNGLDQHASKRMCRWTSDRQSIQQAVDGMKKMCSHLQFMHALHTENGGGASLVKRKKKNLTTHQLVSNHSTSTNPGKRHATCRRFHCLGLWRRPLQPFWRRMEQRESMYLSDR
jgi:hypothetical protein